MFEHRTTPLLPRMRFFLRLVRMVSLGLVFLSVALVIGMSGYYFFEGLPWIDSFANAAMILSGMGPLNPLVTPKGKLFAGLYALFSGSTFITVVGVALSPLVHRVLHRFLLEADDDAADK